MAKQDPANEVLEQGAAQLGKGLLAMFHSPTKLTVFIICLIVCRYITLHRMAIYPDSPSMLFLVWGIPLFLIMGFASSAPKSFDEKFEEIGFKNRNGSYPKVISRKKIKTPKGGVQELVFSSPGIPIEKWKADVKTLESALDGTIISIMKYQGSNQKVTVKMAGNNLVIPTMIEWDNKMLRDKDFELIAGEGLTEDAIFNLNKYPHALIAGMTGSGKSVTLSCLLWQSVLKGAKLYIIDFKGGVEFKNWENANVATVVTDEETALNVLSHLTEEMRQRLMLFTKENVKNIQGYNKKHPEAPLCRIVLGCDEVAEMLDMEGLSKDDKKDKEAISQAMASLARLSRAAGIHMILGMQRPDAKVLKGQIKNNTPIRISGAFPDVVASEIVLGTPDAAYLDNIQGRMLYNLGAQTYEFQAYYFDDDKWIRPGDYQVGDTICKTPINGFTPIAEDEFTEFNIPKEEMAEWDWTDMQF